MQRMVKLFETGDGHVRYPLTAWLLNRYRAELDNVRPDQIVPTLDAPGSWEELYAEVADFLARELGVVKDAALETVFQVQAAVMPREGQAYPLQVELKHDFGRWMQDRRSKDPQAPRRPLAEYPAGTLEVSDPASMAQSDRTLDLVRDHIVRFELASALRPWTSAPRATGPMPPPAPAPSVTASA
jgi:hypothetical protein